MNRKQMIVLIVGSIALITVLLTAPEVYWLPAYPGRNVLVRYNYPRAGFSNAKPTIDWPPTALRISIVAIVGLVAWYVLGDKKDT